MKPKYYYFAPRRISIDPKIRDMILNGYVTLNSVLSRYVYSSEAWLSKFGYS